MVLITLGEFASQLGPISPFQRLCFPNDLPGSDMGEKRGQVVMPSTLSGLI